MVETPGERSASGLNKRTGAAWSGLQGMYGYLLQRIDADPKRTHRLSHAAFAARFRLLGPTAIASGCTIWPRIAAGNAGVHVRARPYRQTAQPWLKRRPVPMPVLAVSSEIQCSPAAGSASAAPAAPGATSADPRTPAPAARSPVHR